MNDFKSSLKNNPYDLDKNKAPKYQSVSTNKSYKIIFDSKKISKPKD